MISFKYSYRAIALAIILMIGQSVFASEFESKCGDSIVGVKIIDGPKTFQKDFHLYYKKNNQEKIEFFKPNDMLYLTAACIQNTKGDYLFLFQEFGYGAEYPDDLYGLFDPKTQKMLLTPKDKDSDVLMGNSKELEKIIGYSLPYMIDDKRTFCCDYIQSPIVDRK
jgi:hypothetical protein